MDKIVGNYRFNTNHLLGRGAYGVVFKGKSQQGQPVAVKMIEKRMINKENEKHLHNEVQSMRSLNHPNIVKFLDYYETQNNIYIISEFCNGGDLRDLIKKGQQNCDQVIDILKQIFKGYKELLNKSIIHRDLKPANILIHDKVIKIADFGFSKKISFDNDLMNSVAGTPLYMAPQVVLRQPYSSKCDIWSIGMIIFELLFQKPPIKATNVLELQDKIKIPIQIPVLENVELQNLLQKFLQLEEDQRIGWDEIYEINTFAQNDYYMEQIEKIEDLQDQEQKIQQQSHSTQLSEYQKLMIENYLQIEFQNNKKLFLNIINTARNLINFSIFVNVQQSYSHYATQLAQNLQNYAMFYLNLLSRVELFKEFDSFINTEDGQYCITQLKFLKQVIQDKKVPFKLTTEDFDSNELLRILEFAINQITTQSAQMNHAKLSFILMAKQTIQMIQHQSQFQNSYFYELSDITTIDQLSDQELAFRIAQI